MTDVVGVLGRYHNDSVGGVVTLPWYKVHGANIGPIWGRQDPGGPHVGPMNFVIWVCHGEKLSSCTKGYRNNAALIVMPKNQVFFEAPLNNAWWCHGMETFFALMFVCGRNSPVNLGFLSLRVSSMGFDEFLDVNLNEMLNKQSRYRWF